MKDMKFVVLIWAVFQMLSFTASDTNSTTTESYTLIKSTNLAKPGCESRCGNLTVPYPFGLGDNSECYINVRFRIYCNNSVNPPKATIYPGGYNSIKLISDSTIRLSNQLASRCYDANGIIYNDFKIAVTLTGKPYSFSEVNKFTVIGCYDSSWLETSTERDLWTGCMVYCSLLDEFVGDECGGNGCCQSPIPNYLISYSTSIYSLLDIPDNRSFSTCTYSFVGDENLFKFKGRNDLNDTNFKKRIEDTVPIVLEWAIGNRGCSEAKATDGYACQSNSICVSTRESGGYRCECKEGYEGNPYLDPGCQDINECDDKSNCYGHCKNTEGSYDCTCWPGYIGNAKTPDGCRLDAKGSKFPVTIFTLGMITRKRLVRPRTLPDALKKKNLIFLATMLHVCFSTTIPLFKIVDGARLSSSATFEVKCSLQLINIQEVLGPCTSLEKNGPSLCIFFDMARQSITTNNPVYIQFFARYLHRTGHCKQRVTTLIRKCTIGPNRIQDLVGGFDHEAAATVLGRLVSHKIKTKGFAHFLQAPQNDARRIAKGFTHTF